MFEKILVIHKKSVYRLNFLERKGYLHKLEPAFKNELRRFKQAHADHYETIKKVKDVLAAYDIKYVERYRGQKLNYAPFDLIITVGGDGTFLETAQNVNKNQVLVGVNSSLRFSVGSFCIANSGNFEQAARSILTGHFKTVFLQRLRLKFSNQSRPVDALNDILVSHKNPAVLCRYYLRIKGAKEEQRSSGVWISTPAGSSGAIKSAGGKVLPQHDRRIQYMPRELYAVKKRRYRFKGAVLNPRETIAVTSLMNEGMIYVDGANLKFPFPYGSNVKVSLSPNPIRTIAL